MYMSIIIRIDSFLYNFVIEINFAKLLAILLEISTEWPN